MAQEEGELATFTWGSSLSQERRGEFCKVMRDVITVAVGLSQVLGHHEVLCSVRVFVCLCMLDIHVYVHRWVSTCVYSYQAGDWCPVSIFITLHSIY